MLALDLAPLWLGIGITPVAATTPQPVEEPQDAQVPAPQPGGAEDASAPGPLKEFEVGFRIEGHLRIEANGAADAERKSWRFSKELLAALGELEMDNPKPIQEGIAP